MNERTATVASRREALQRRCAMQREQLAAAIADVESRLHDIDRATLVLRKFRLGPVLLAVIGTAVAATPLLRNISGGLTLANTLATLLRSRRRTSEP